MDSIPIIVGTEDCPIEAIQEILWKDPIIGRDWSQLARGLRVPSDRVEKLRKDMLLDKLTKADVVFQLLELWVGQEGSGATLDALLKVLEEQLGADGAGESLRIQFNLPCKAAATNPAIDWGDLSPAFQNQVRQNFQTFFPDAEFANALPRLRGPVLINLMTGKKPSLTFYKSTIPDIPTYYIPRTLITRNIISRDIFDHNTPDIFLFKGMDRSELSKLAKDKITGESREQLNCKDIKPRFLILNQDNHFGKLCGKTSIPVHLLRKEADGRLRWIRSNGNMAYLQSCIDITQSQDELDEEQFCKSLNSQNTPVCISDSPGMGKSLLLAVIGRRLAQMYPDRIVHFVELTEFIKSVKQHKGEDKIKWIGKVIHILFGEAVVQSELGPEEEQEVSLSVELLLDGFDELDSSDYQLAYDILEITKTHFKSIRIWVTSRPHLLNELECQLNQLGHNIREFLLDDQIHFLSSYWSRKKTLNRDKCHQFANRCLDALKSKMNYADHDIAGIPLQCLLIGESFEEDAIAIAGRDREIDLHVEVEIEIDTITNLYSNLIKKKIPKFIALAGESAPSESDMMSIHVRLSVEAIFPDHLGLGFSPIGQRQLKQILQIGVLESSSTTQAPRFMHRTFAEYFVAWYIVNGMQKKNSPKKQWFRIFSRTLATQTQVEIGYDSFKFTYPVIIYFIDALIPHISTFPSPSAIHLGEESIRRIVHSCANANYVQLFHFFLRLNIINKGSISQFQHDVLIVAIWNSDLEFVKTVVEIIEQQHRFDTKTKVIALRRAVKRGKFSILEYFLKEKELHNILLGFEDHACELIHDCVENSKNDTVVEIEQKVHILRTLVGIRPSLLEEKGGLWKEPSLLCYGAHVRLLRELISLGANVSTLGIGGCSILHINESRGHLSSKDFHELVLCIPEERLTQLIQKKEEDKDSPLMTILRWFDPLPETLQLFKRAGASFKLSDANQNSILEIAIQNGRSDTTTRLIVEFGGKIHWRPLKGVAEFFGFQNQKGNTLLHCAAKSGNLEATKLLLENKRMDVNVKDKHGLTPLDYALMDGATDENYFQVGLLLLQGGGTVTNNVQFGNPGHQRLLHAAVKRRELQLAQLLIQRGVHVNCKNSRGNTPLHFVANKKILLF